ncbi:GNAT family N-acetyltransferase [Chitinophaga sp.]|uniref:GNAT family N-acetyltransferase n=1 Tax=Chitinophaga sp. TaxID=1869181 RepID=UPI0039C8B3A8
MYHLWYLGVRKAAAGKGTGTSLINELIEDAKAADRPIYVESRIESNTAWYKKRGFRLYYELYHAGRHWSCLRIENHNQFQEAYT